jgi:Cu(I)/Ag(I) efflux system membrane fusion protein
MQPGGELQNPYWGSEMLTCGEVVRDMAMPVGEVPSIARTVQ